MCHICQFIIKEQPDLKSLDNFKRSFPNVYIIKPHLPTIAAIAKEYSPTLIKEIMNEKATSPTTNTNNG